MPQESLRLTKPTIRVLQALTDRPREEHHGFDLIRRTGLKSGTVYPILIRLEGRGWLVSRWEETDRAGPRKRLYRLTAEGEPAARKLLAKTPATARGRGVLPEPARGLVR